MKEQSSFLDVDIAWGGFYAAIPAENGDVSIFKLLDFNQYAYHAAFFTEKFDDIPDFSAVAELSPFVGHAPVVTESLLTNARLCLIGRVPLSRADLEGYKLYLEAHDMPEAQREALANQLTEFSHASPLSLRLQMIGDKLVISERA